MSDIEAKLNDLGQEVLKRFPDVNRGGCCVYAAMIVKALAKHGIPSRGIVAAYGAREPHWNLNKVVTIDDARRKVQKNTIREWQNNGVSFNHVGVEFTINGVKKHYDTAGVHPASMELEDMPIYTGRMEYVEMRTLAGSPAGWNPSFDRRNIPALRKLVKNRLSDKRCREKKEMTT